VAIPAEVRERVQPKVQPPVPYCMPLFLPAVAFLRTIDDAVAAKGAPLGRLGRASAVGGIAVVLAVVALLAGDRHAVAASRNARSRRDVESVQCQFVRRSVGLAFGLEYGDLVDVADRKIAKLCCRSGVKRDRARGRRMQSAQIDGKFLVDEDPDVVVADEIELVGCASFVLEPIANLAGETEVVQSLVALRVHVIGQGGVVERRNLRGRQFRSRRERVLIDGKEKRVAVDARLPLLAVRAVAVHVAASLLFFHSAILAEVGWLTPLGVVRYHSAKARRLSMRRLGR
jgi:hypothetical protein